ncbi:MAG: S-layer homology domain-containing protein [Oscillospiraceae bacterium]|nr:S-layer homology domain-containing protein [Oscillospiraceae bacterium]
MFNKRKIAALLAPVMLLSSVPAFSAADDAASRQAAIYEFVTAVGENSFSGTAADLSAYADGAAVDERYKSAVALAVGNGLIKGYDDNSIRPENTITRLEALIILGRCLPGIDAVRGSTDFTDVPEWAEAEIDRLYRAGLVNGYGNGLLGADDNITFSQLALLTERVRSAGAKAPDLEPGLKDDFYSTVNAEYLANTVLESGELSASYMDTIAKTVNDRLNQISLDIVADHNAGLIPYDDAMDDEAAKLYKLALESDRSSDTDLGQLKVLLRKVMSSDDVNGLAIVNGELIRDYGVSVLFSVGIPYAERSKNVRTSFGIQIQYLGTGYNRGIWEEVDGSRESYTKYIYRLMTLMKDVLEFPVTEDFARRVTDMQIEIEKSAPTLREKILQSRDAAPDSDNKDDDNRFTYRELRLRYSEDRDDELRHDFHNNELAQSPITNTLKTINERADQDTKTKYVIPYPEYMDKAIDMLYDADPDVIKAIGCINLLEAYMSFLPRPYRDARAQFSRDILGGGEIETSADYATGMATALYAESYEKRYLAKYGSEAETEAAKALTEEILDGFREKLRSSSYFSHTTASKAIEKLDKMTSKIAEVERSVGDDERYLIISSKNTMIDLGISLNRAGNSLYRRINAASPCYTVNASYDRYRNSFSVYAGLIEAPYYSESLTEEELLAGLGFVIAHEISHALDESGSLYNSTGIYGKWWDDSDRAAFTAKARKLAEIYSGHQSAVNNNIDGELTSDENIADIMAMDCILTIAKEKNLDLDALFRAYAQNWAEVRSSRYDRYCTKFDTHSDGKTRVNAVLSNFDEFYETYGITEGDGMYVAPGNRIKFI